MKAHQIESGFGNYPDISRRRFLVTTGAAVAASCLPLGGVLGQGGAKFRRMNVSDKEGIKSLESYRRAIKAMLKLPPTDPRNWYRQAFIHLLDCPHGNWWFPPWHRGYLGWFEQTCRVLSKDPKFALPYWDWTAEPRIPPSFFKDVLNPSDAAYIKTLKDFKDQFNDPMDKFWKGLSADQLKQLELRDYKSMDAIWEAVKNGPMFFKLEEVRSLTKDKPDFDKDTKKAVSLATIKDALAPTEYLKFGSDKSDQHSKPKGYAILEGQPHNNVHGNVGGFMGDFLSPVDPIFFMHHANIDRLWDVWTRKQQAAGFSTVPPKGDLDAWQKEPFLFFTDSGGKPVKKNTAGDYAAIGEFDYDYQSGSGEEVVKTSVTPFDFSNKLFEAALTRKTLDLQQSTQGAAEVPEELRAVVMEPNGPRLFAQVTIRPPDDTRDLQFHVVLNPLEGAQSIAFEDLSYAGTFEFFGSHQHGAHTDESISFMVGLTEAVKKLREANRLTKEPLRIHVVPGRKGVSLASLEVPLSAISVGAF